MRGIEVDPEARTARVEAGVLALELGEAAAEHGLCSLPGSSPDVGVTGYTLGGGLSWLGRRYGFACNRVRAIELVTADGEQRTVDAENDPDLFWALRGGGGGYGDGHRAAGRTCCRSPRSTPARCCLPGRGRRRRRSAPTATGPPASPTTSPRSSASSPRRTIPDVPEPLRGTPLLTIDAACIGDQAEGEAAIAPLREIGETIMDTFGQMPAAGALRDPHGPREPGARASATTAVLASSPTRRSTPSSTSPGPDSGSPLLLSELRHLGGALGRPDRERRRPLPPRRRLRHVRRRHADDARAGRRRSTRTSTASNETMEPWAADGGYFNFAERPCDTDAILPADVCARLAEVKRK